MEVELGIADPVALIRLNRPDKLNAFTYPMLGEIRRAVDAAAADPRVVGIVITGNGRGFCAGLDAEALAATTTRGSAARERPPAAEAELPGLFSYLLRVPKPVIAAVNGVAAGGGFVLASMCDVRFASKGASFTSIFTKRGLVAEHGTTWTVPRLVGSGRALDLLWTSRLIDAEEAARIGLVEYLVEPHQIVTEASRYVAELAATVSPAALADTKRMVYEHLGEGYAAALPDADATAWRAVDRADAREGAQALLERRAPKFARLGAKAG
ncbi:MAG TPA: enoyl-CoA hydratase-related protein [Myxococcota bacterium]|nr:enoyl-CoA hydratase-related protein [Myxococcota bacterium]